MRDLEAWSMELARHCPEARESTALDFCFLHPYVSVLQVIVLAVVFATLKDWNQCCGILVQCLSGSEKESANAPFRVQRLEHLRTSRALDVR